MLAVGLLGDVTPLLPWHSFHVPVKASVLTINTDHACFELLISVAMLSPFWIGMTFRFQELFECPPKERSDFTKRTRAPVGALVLT
jgi:hypothetical protein